MSSASRAECLLAVRRAVAWKQSYFNTLVRNRLHVLPQVETTIRFNTEGDLHDVAQVAAGHQLQALPLRPGLDGGQPLPQDAAPVVGAQARTLGCWADEPVEQPGADEVEELREELDGEGGAEPAAAAQRHGAGQGGQHRLCNHRDTRQLQGSGLKSS